MRRQWGAPALEMLNLRRLSILVLVMLASISTQSQSANARIVLKEKVTYYNVTGKNGREIFKSMIKNGPKVGRRESHALATTEYKYDVKNVKVALKAGRCVLTDFEVHMAVKYTYPRWRGSSGASKDTRTAWRSFQKTVIWHEEEHVRIARGLAADYEKALKRSRFRFKTECDPNSISLNWRVGFANIRNNRLQRQFDRRDLKPGGRGYEAQLRLLKAK